MPKIDETIINYAVYEDAVEYYGMASVTLPEITNLTNTISGAGISGNYEAVTMGFVEAMSMTLTFRVMTDASIRLAEPRRHNLELRAAQQSEDTENGEIQISSVKHVAVLTPKKLGLGTLAPSSPANVSGEYSVSYLATYIDGVKTLEIDPFNFLYFVNGKDYLAEVRNAIGK